MEAQPWCGGFHFIWPGLTSWSQCALSFFFFPSPPGETSADKARFYGGTSNKHQTNPNDSCLPQLSSSGAQKPKVGASKRYFSTISSTNVVKSGSWTWLDTAPVTSESRSVEQQLKQGTAETQDWRSEPASINTPPLSQWRSQNSLTTPVKTKRGVHTLAGPPPRTMLVYVQAETRRSHGIKRRRNPGGSLHFLLFLPEVCGGIVQIGGKKREKAATCSHKDDARG